MWMTEGTQSISVPGQWEGECKFGASFSGAPCKGEGIGGRMACPGKSGGFQYCPDAVLHENSSVV